MQGTVAIARFLRFAFVGGIGFVVDAGLLLLLHHGAGFDPFSSRLISISLAAFSTWRLNRIVTFGASPAGQAAEGLRYATVAALTAGFNYFVYCLALALWSGLPPLAAAIIATLSAMSLSYLGYSSFVFHGSSTLPTLGVPRSQRR
jgi:putative flippase GtrA